MLEEMRIGSLSPDSESLLHRLKKPLKYHDDLSPVELYPRRILADSANMQRMDRLPDKPMTYRARDRFRWDIDKRPITPENGRILLDRNRMAAESVEFKVKKACPFICANNEYLGIGWRAGDVRKGVYHQLQIARTNHKHRTSRQ